MPIPNEVVTDQMIDIPGGQIFIRQWKPSIILFQEPLILLHDSLGSVEQWRAFPSLLARTLGRTVYAYDRWGFGKSSARTHLPPLTFIEDEASLHFPAIYRALGIKTFAVFGHSVGGAMALNIASLYQEECLAVVSESAQAFVEDRTRQGILAAKAAFQDENQLLKLKKWHGEKASWVLKAWIDTWLSPHFSDWQIKTNLSNVKAPTLIIHGDQDEYGSLIFPNTIAENLVGPHDKEIITGGGHNPHRDSPELVLQLVQQFFAQFKS